MHSMMLYLASLLVKFFLINGEILLGSALSRLFLIEPEKSEQASIGSSIRGLVGTLLQSRPKQRLQPNCSAIRPRQSELWGA
jgi:hypothetical protein